MSPTPVDERARRGRALAGKLEPVVLAGALGAAWAAITWPRQETAIVLVSMFVLALPTLFVVVARLARIEEWCRALSRDQLRRGVIAVGLLTALTMGIYPPWTASLSVKDLHATRPAGYSLLTRPPSGESASDEFGVGGEMLSINVDLTRLGLQWAMVGMAVAGALSLLREQ